MTPPDSITVATPAAAPSVTPKTSVDEAYDVGDSIGRIITFTDATTGSPIDPTSVTGKTRAPDGDVADVTPSTLGNGQYLLSWSATLPGRWHFQATGVSDDTQVVEGHVDVKLSAFAENPDPYLPTIHEVAALLRSKTNDGRGDTVATFTAETRPRYDEVLSNCYLARDQVGSTIGNRLDTGILGDSGDDTRASIVKQLIHRSRGIAALIAAALTELGSPNPRQIVVDSFNSMASSQLKALSAQIVQAGQGADVGPADDGGRFFAAFPRPAVLDVEDSLRETVPGMPSVWHW